MEPWKRVYVDTIEQWETSTMEHKKGKRGLEKKIRNKIMTLCAMNVIDEDNSWPEMIKINDKTSYENSRCFDRE